MDNNDKLNFNIIEEGSFYELPEYEVIDNVGIQKTGEVLQLRFVRGSKLKDENVERRNGIVHETLLAAVIHDLKFKNELVPSRESSIAITKLEEGLMWLTQRSKVRQQNNTLGTYKK